MLYVCISESITHWFIDLHVSAVCLYPVPHTYLPLHWQGRHFKRNATLTVNRTWECSLRHPIYNVFKYICHPSERSMALIITDLVCVECFVSIKLLSLSALSSMYPATSWLNVFCLDFGHWTLLTSAMVLDGNNALHGKTNTNYLLVEPLQHCRWGSAGRDYHTG